MSLPSMDFDYVSGLLHEDSAIALAPGKEYLVESRLLPVALETGMSSVPELVAELKRRPDHDDLRRRVVDAMTTNETSWFRDGAPFEALTGELFDELRDWCAPDGILRVWSAGCSSGQEPYSLVMTLAEPLRAVGYRLDVLATDLSEEMLARARAGRYTQLEMDRGMPCHLVGRHFTRVGREWQISAALRAAVRFEHLNLAEPFPPLPVLDVVFLRNVLIYFDTCTKTRVLDAVSRVLRPDGLLFLGSAETTINLDPRFERVTIGAATAYRFRTQGAAS